MKRKPIINTHCHFLNLDFVPDRMSKELSKFPEWFLRSKLSNYMVRVVSIFTYPKWRKMSDYLNTFRLKKISKVVNKYMKWAKEAGIDIVVPLMMDLEQAVGPYNPDPTGGNIPYWEEGQKNQIDLISEQAALHPWRIFPFVMFDPWRRDADEICIRALSEKGFIGVKMYPALGYHPSYNHMKKYNPIGAEYLRNVYAYCEKHKVPITTHASVGGSYKIDSKQDVIWGNTEVSNWLDPINDYDLKINFAHFGGNYLQTRNEKSKRQSATWRNEITNLIVSSQNTDGVSRVFSDLSYHDMAISIHSDRYFYDLRKYLDDKNFSSRILFGTDALMISHTWTEEEYINVFRENLKPGHQELIFSDNPTRFLFDNTRIPDSYIEFLKSNLKHGVDPFVNLPPWIREKSGKYYIVTG